MSGLPWSGFLRPRLRWKGLRFSLLHGALDQLMYSLRCEPAHEHEEGSKRRSFHLEPSEEGVGRRPCVFFGEGGGFIHGAVALDGT